MSHSDTIPLHQSSQSDIDEIENLINASVQTGPSTVLPARPPSPPRASIPVSSSPFLQSNLPPLPPNRVFRSRLLSSLLPRPCLSPVMGGLICRRLVSDHRPTLSPNRYGIRSRGICPGSSAIWSLWYFPTLSVRTLERLWGIGICGGLSFSLCSSVLLFPGLHRSRRLAL